MVVTAAPAAVAVTGIGEAHRHQHLTEADLTDLGARRAATTALAQAGRSVLDVGAAGIYDSFTVTLAMLLEEIGFCAPGTAGADAAAARRPSSGVGRVVAVSVVHPLSACSSGPFGEPYTLALVDLDDGIRAMGRGDPGLTVGASVRVKFPDGIPRWAPCP